MPDSFLGQEIMANITGFGNTMTVGAPALSDPNQHPRQLHQQQQQQMMYASNQQQQQTAAVPSNPAEIGKGAYVKILEEPAENKLRFR